MDDRTLKRKNAELTKRLKLGGLRGESTKRLSQEVSSELLRRAENRPGPPIDDPYAEVEKLIAKKEKENAVRQTHAFCRQVKKELLLEGHLDKLDQFYDGCEAAGMDFDNPTPHDVQVIMPAQRRRLSQGDALTDTQIAILTAAIEMEATDRASAQLKSDILKHSGYPGSRDSWTALVDRKYIGTKAGVGSWITQAGINTLT